MFRIAFTGHRQVLHEAALTKALKDLGKSLVARVDSPDGLIIHTGGAAGLDTMAMRTLRTIGHHVLHIPFTYQSGPILNSPVNLPDHWTLCASCGPVAWDGNKRRFQARNEHMVDSADILYAYYNTGSRGGTANCIRYAMEVQKPVINIITGEPITIHHLETSWAW